MESLGTLKFSRYSDYDNMRKWVVSYYPEYVPYIIDFGMCETEFNKIKKKITKRATYANHEKYAQYFGTFEFKEKGKAIADVLETHKDELIDDEAVENLIHELHNIWDYEMSTTKERIDKAEVPFGYFNEKGTSYLAWHCPLGFIRRRLERLSIGMSYMWLRKCFFSPSNDWTTV